MEVNIISFALEFSYLSFTNTYPHKFDINVFVKLGKLLMQHYYFFSGCYKLALRDIELSLTSGYPEDKAFKLEERKGQ